MQIFSFHNRRKHLKKQWFDLALTKQNRGKKSTWCHTVQNENKTSSWIRYRETVNVSETLDSCLHNSFHNSLCMLIRYFGSFFFGSPVINRDRLEKKPFRKLLIVLAFVSSNNALNYILQVKIYYAKLDSVASNYEVKCWDRFRYKKYFSLDWHVQDSWQWKKRYYFFTLATCFDTDFSKCQRAAMSFKKNLLCAWLKTISCFGTNKIWKNFFGLTPFLISFSQSLILTLWSRGNWAISKTTPLATLVCNRFQSST